MLSGVEFDCDPIRAALDPAILTHFYGQKLPEMAKNGPPVAECDVPVPGIPGTGIFSFFGGIGTGIRKKLVPEKKISEPVSEKFGTGKSTGIGIEYIWYRKKVSVSFNILGTVTH